ncbi:MAG: hypothetical protein ACYDH5_18865 [Acidimicrobiales bacterium]
MADDGGNLHLGEARRPASFASTTRRVNAFSTCGVGRPCACEQPVVAVRGAFLHGRTPTMRP